MGPAFALSVGSRAKSAGLALKPYDRGRSTLSVTK